MAELHNPLFENEKEFLERQKLEYERALMGDVEEIKAKTQKVGKIALIGAGVASGVWLLSKVFGSSKSSAKKLGTGSKNRKKKKRLKSGAPLGVGAVSDDLGFGSAPLTASHSHGRPAQLAPDVYHTDAPEADPFPPLPPRPTQFAAPNYHAPEPEEEDSGFTSIVADGVQAFLKSDTGKMLMAQATAVVMAYAAKKGRRILAYGQKSRPCHFFRARSSGY
ncbi:hypothetical protein F1C16_17450 [Hymenobacter sp. NBH84]|uniref:hypothetical protein n=1 Tax=Hymenobacter sp. NBH84 TaxID=2596915 RepID=UPI001623E581|nr:hypothetical protein [Hymenobacter sp. NBH84]QNE41214.1 hypothetical protein F1C16_17450 [Hymenobacter sp. NBH84]